ALCAAARLPPAGVPISVRGIRRLLTATGGLPTPLLRALPAERGQRDVDPLASLRLRLLSLRNRPWSGRKEADSADRRARHGVGDRGARAELHLHRPDRARLLPGLRGRARHRRYQHILIASHPDWQTALAGVLAPAAPLSPLSRTSLCPGPASRPAPLVRNLAAPTARGDQAAADRPRQDEVSRSPVTRPPRPHTQLGENQ